MGEVRENFFCQRGSIISLEGSQASPACPSDPGNVKLKTLEWVEAGAAEF
jgi:hypothetical protein